MVLRVQKPLVAELHNQPVVVVTDAGIPISVGRLLVTNDSASGAVVRLDVEFETIRMKCVIRISPEKWDGLLTDWDGEATRYVVSHGDGFWMDVRDKNKVHVLAEFLRHGPASPPKSRPRRSGPPS